MAILQTISCVYLSAHDLMTHFRLLNPAFANSLKMGVCKLA